MACTLRRSPLTHTAHEYYAMQYDRKADVHAPFGRRKTPEQLEEAARKAEEKAAKKAAKQAEKEARKAEKAARKGCRRCRCRGRSHGRVKTARWKLKPIPMRPMKKVRSSSHPMTMHPEMMDDDDELSMLEDAESNTRPN
jgi:sRNA-binding protein